MGGRPVFCRKGSFAKPRLCEMDGNVVWLEVAAYAENGVGEPSDGKDGWGSREGTPKATWEFLGSNASGSSSESSYVPGILCRRAVGSSLTAADAAVCLLMLWSVPGEAWGLVTSAGPGSCLTRPIAPDLQAGPPRILSKALLFGVGRDDWANGEGLVDGDGRPCSCLANAASLSSVAFLLPARSSASFCRRIAERHSLSSSLNAWRLANIGVRCPGRIHNLPGQVNNLEAVVTKIVVEPEAGPGPRAESGAGGTRTRAPRFCDAPRIDVEM